MSYARSDGDVFLDAKQTAIVKFTAQDLVRRGVLVPLPVSRVLP